MKDQTIFRHDVLRLMDTGEDFDLVFITADRRRGTGGKPKTVKSWAKVKGDPAEVRIPGKQLSKTKLNELRKAAGLKIINIFNPSSPADHIISVHYQLMIFFNGKRIID